MKTLLKYAAAAPVCLMSYVTTVPVYAQNADVAPRAGTWFTQFGAVIIDYRKKSEVQIDGVPAPGVAANVTDDLTLGNGYGYYITPNISVMAVLGVGPQTSIKDNAGNRLGEIWYGAPSVVFDYHFTNFGALQPFVGAGASYIAVFDETDGVIKNLQVDSALGLVLRAGAEVMLDRNFGVFFAANKIIVDTDARGLIDAGGGPVPIAAHVDLDPWVYQGGFTFRY